MTNNPQDKERALDIWLGLTGQAPLPAGPLVMPVLSGSMRPIIPLGSRILIEPCQANECHPGDVVVYLEGDRLVAHRMLWKIGSRYFFKGDANPFGHWTPAQRICGLVKEVLPDHDNAGVFPGQSPFCLETMRDSRRQYLRDIVLFLPRKIRDFLTGKQKDSSPNPPEDP